LRQAGGAGGEKNQSLALIGLIRTVLPFPPYEGGLCPSFSSRAISLVQIGILSIVSAVSARNFSESAI